MYSDGLVGLAPREIGDKVQDLFVEDLYLKNEIPLNLFSMFIGEETEQSYLRIGGFWEPNKTEVEWVDLNGTNEWRFKLGEVKLSNKSISVISKTVIIDSSSGFTYLPRADYD
mmetsp:Transcript_30764/g.22860  ORF Transcript_30764/g.22860 Transcript_30764/m.22860 type:complete len:113 (-) Transcript_30764:678-1016(-)